MTGDGESIGLSTRHKFLNTCLGIFLQSTVPFTINIRYNCILNHNFVRKTAHINVKKLAVYIHRVKDFYRMTHIKPQIYALFFLILCELHGCFALLLSVVAVP